ncbi:hypothetical protein ACTMTI_14690 [Nonomuraea sp. H19]|uniref:hypothetical protein n=1 Tax=Nonomuraea sp. H19 TaxID=3452206 RepID=UPI003F89D35B
MALFREVSGSAVRPGTGPLCPRVVGAGDGVPVEVAGGFVGLPSRASLVWRVATDVFLGRIPCGRTARGPRVPVVRAPCGGTVPGVVGTPALLEAGGEETGAPETGVPEAGVAGVGATGAGVAMGLRLRAAAGDVV